MLRLPVVVQVPLAGSYSSALVEGAKSLSSPAATSTWPLGSNVAVCRSRAALRLPVAVQLPVAGSYKSSACGNAAGVNSPSDKHHAVWQQRRRVIRACDVETARGGPAPARRIVQFRARENVVVAIKPPCNKHHAVGQQRRRMLRACDVEAASDSPVPAVWVRWRFDIQSFLADISLSSLPQRARHHLDSEKQQNEQEHSPKEMGSDGSGGPLNHFGFSFVCI